MPNRATWTDTFLKTARPEADPLADVALAELLAVEGPKAGQALFDTLIRNVGLPVEQLPPVLKLGVQNVGKFMRCFSTFSFFVHKTESATSRPAFFAALIFGVE